jgi:hypothetical protein
MDGAHTAEIVRIPVYRREPVTDTAVEVVTTWPLLAGVVGIATALDVKVTIDGDFDGNNNWSVSEIEVQVWPLSGAEDAWVPLGELAATSPVWAALNEQIWADPDRTFDRDGALSDAWAEAHFDR